MVWYCEIIQQRLSTQAWNEAISESIWSTSANGQTDCEEKLTSSLEMPKEVCSQKKYKELQK